MTNQSFFHLTPPANDDCCTCDHDEADPMTEAERTAFNQQSEALFTQFMETVDTFSEAHPGLTYSVILDAAKCLIFCLEEDLKEDACDA